MGYLYHTIMEKYKEDAIKKKTLRPPMTASAFQQCCLPFGKILNMLHTEKLKSGTKSPKSAVIVPVPKWCRAYLPYILFFVHITLFLVYLNPF